MVHVYVKLFLGTSLRGFFLGMDDGMGLVLDGAEKPLSPPGACGRRRWPQLRSGVGAPALGRQIKKTPPFLERANRKDILPCCLFGTAPDQCRASGSRMPGRKSHGPREVFLNIIARPVMRTVLKLKP